MRFLPGSNAEPELRMHAPVNVGDSRRGEASSHALATTLRAEDEGGVRQVEIKRGDITVGVDRCVAAMNVVLFQRVTCYTRLFCFPPERTSIRRNSYDSIDCKPSP
jgi:hypothetical protein